MEKRLLSALAVVAMGCTLWLLFVRPSTVDPSDGLAIPESNPQSTAPPLAHLPEAPRTSSSPRTPLEEPKAQPEAPEPKAPRPLVARPASPPEPGNSKTSIKVLVVDTADRPISGARVMPAQATGHPRFLDSTLDSSNRLRTGSDGRLTCRTGQGGRIRIIAIADGYSPNASEVFDPEQSPSPSQVRITLSEGGSVEGELTNLHGEPARGVFISLHLHRWPDALERAGSAYILTTETEKDGYFLFENVTPGNYTLQTSADGELADTVPAQRAELIVEVGKRTRAEFPQISQSFVRVHGVVTRNLEPLAGARINVNWADSKRGYLGKQAMADEEGRFTVILDEAGGYRFQISPRDGGSLFQEIDIPHTEEHEIEISFETGGISGFLLGPDGEGLEGIQILALGRSAAGHSNSSVHNGVSGPDGAFVFTDLEDGTYELKAQSREMFPDPQDAPAHPLVGRVEQSGVQVKAGSLTSGIQLRLSRAAAVEGRVIEDTGDVVPGAKIEFRGPSTLDDCLWKADSAGEFLAGGLAQGSYKVRATHERMASPWIPVQAKIDSTVAMEPLMLRPGSMIEVDATVNGESAGHVLVKLLLEDGLRVESTIFSHGKGQLGPVLPGTYTLTLKPWAKRDSPGTQRTVVVDGQPTIPVAIELR